MITKERQARIIARLNETSFVSVKELTEELNTSRSSIVRDLIELENQGLLVRERGGAALKSMDNVLTSLNEVTPASKEMVNLEEKKMICATAAQTIRDGECVYIDSGTTTTHLLEYIPNKKFTLVTSSVYLIRKLPSQFAGEVFLLGGNFDLGLDTSKGTLTLDMIDQFHFDHSFMSANGLNLDNGDVYTVDFDLGAVKREIMKRSTRSYLLMDASKYHTKAISTWAQASDFHTIYVDSYPEDKELLENINICQGGK